MEAEEFRRAAYAVVDRIVDYRRELATRALAVQSPNRPGELLAALPPRAPETPEPLQAILGDVERLIIPGLTHWQHPRFFGYFPAGAGFASVLADLLSTGLGVVGLNWQSSPALTELETGMMNWMRDLLGLPSSWSGVIQDTASSATLVALLCARERSTNYGAARGGLQAEPAPLIVYATDETHSSVMKAAALAGFGRDNVRSIAVDEGYAMRVDALEAVIREDRARGAVPCGVVATVGTTGTTAIDPVRALVDVAARECLWLHVDAALGGAAMLLPEYRHLWSGVENADSLVVNAHKWMTVAPDCSLYFVQDSQHLIRVMSSNPSYLRTDVDAQVTNYRDWGIPLGRRFRALKLWLTLRAEGAEGLRDRIRRDCANAQWLAHHVDATPCWRRVAPVPFQTVCIVHQPPPLSGDALDRHTLAWCRRINSAGFAYLTPAIVAGRWVVRVSVGSDLTERRDVQELWDVMQRTAQECLRDGTP